MDSVAEEARAEAVSAVIDLARGHRPEKIRMEADSIAEESRASPCASTTSWRPSRGSNSSRRRRTWRGPSGAAGAVRRRLAVPPGGRRRLAPRSVLFRDPSVVSKVSAMATTARADVEAKERAAREAKWKAKKAKREAAAKAAAAPGTADKSESSAKKDNIKEGNVRSSPARILQPVSETGSSGGARPAACGRAVLCGCMPGGARGRWSRVSGGEGGGYNGGAWEMEISCPTDVHQVPRSPSTAFMNSSTSCQVQG